MAQVVKNNLMATKAYNILKNNDNELAKSLKKVSSGMRVNSAQDGASEYSISAKMDVMIRSLGQNTENTETGRNLVKVAEGGMQDIVENIRTMKELALNSANDTNTDIDREIIQKEFSSRMDTIIDIASTTSYNGRLLLNGDYAHRYEDRGDTTVIENKLGDLTTSFSPVTGTSREGAMTGSRLKVTAPVSYSGTPIEIKLDFSSASKGGDEVSCPDDFNQQGFFILCGGCPQYINIKFDATTSVSTYLPNGSPKCGMAREYIIGISDVTSVGDLPKAVFEGIKNAVGRTEAALVGGYVNPDGTKRTGIAVPDGGTWDADFSVEQYREYAKDSEDGTSIAVDGEHNLRIVDNKDGTYSLWRLGGPSMGIRDGVFENQKVDVGKPLIIHTGPKDNQYIPIYINSMHPIAMGLNAARVNTREQSMAAIGIVDSALNYVLDEITLMGAYQMELDETKENLITANENMISSKSTIQDADMAKEMQIYTKNNVLAQSAQSMLSQANQASSSVLDLLG